MWKLAGPVRQVLLVLEDWTPALFDMSEYASGDALARLIGSAWGGHSEGELTRRVREHPFCVVLLDEFEKAHPAVFDALLGVMGEGRLTGADGSTTDFRNAIVVMTSNLGASRGEMQPVGFGASKANADTEEGDGQLEAHFLKEAERFFRPEFFNRIDRIVTFRPLSMEAIRQITRRELGKLLMREGVVRRKLLVEIDDAVIEELLTQGFHPLYGARPLQREIERAVILPLARLVVEKNPDDSHLLRFGMREGRIRLNLTPLDAADEKTALTAAPATTPERKLETDLDKVLDSVRDLRERSTAEEANPAVGRLRDEMSALLERTYAPTFWDDPAAARGVLGRVYHIERVLKRLDALATRAERLEEKGRQIRIHRDRRSVPSFTREVEALRIQFDYLQAELTGVGEGHDQAILRVAPVSQDARPWAARLLTLYTSWAERKGYEYSAFDTSQPPEEISEEASPEPSAIYVKGSNVYELLRGEVGLHKLSSGTAEERRRELAHVTVLPVQDAAVPDDPAQLHAVLTHLVKGGADADADHENAAFVRIYHEGRERFVRDPRTGVRLTDVSSVLEDGRIDEFLLASLRRSTTNNSPEDTPTVKSNNSG
jgi:protein subunit release factor A